MNRNMLILGLWVTASAIAQAPEVISKDCPSWYKTVAREFFGTVVTGLPRAISCAVGVLRSKGPLETFVKNKRTLQKTVVSRDLSDDLTLTYEFVDPEEANAAGVPVLKVCYLDPATNEFKQGYEVDPFACFREEWALAKQEELLFDRHLQTLWVSFKRWIIASDVPEWKKLTITSRILGLSVLAGLLGSAGYSLKRCFFDADEDSEGTLLGDQKAAKA